MTSARVVHASRTARPGIRGVAYILASAVAFSAMSVLVKVATPRVPLGQLVFARGVFTLALSWLLLRRARVPIRGTNRRGLLFRGFIGFLGLACYYAALGHLPLAYATTVQNATPIVTAGFAWLWLGETPHARVIIGIFLGVIGVAMVSLVRPAVGHGNVALWAVAVALVGTLFSATAYVTVRELAKTEHPLRIVFFFPLVATPLALPWAVWQWHWLSFYDWGLLLAIAVATQLGQVLLTLGLTHLPAGQATAIGYIQTVFAAGWGVWLFDEALHPPIVAGLLCIGGAVLLVATGVGRSQPERSAT